MGRSPQRFLKKGDTLEAVVLAVDRKVQFYRSTDLKRWTLLS